MQNKVKSYGIGIVIPVAVGLLSALLSGGGMGFYQTIVQPPFAPPGILFPIVWTVLYILMGVGSAVVYNANAPQQYKNRAILLYGAQLAVNFIWSIFFFNLQAFLFSFIWLVLLWILIVAMIISFYKIDKTAAYLQIPYLLWVTFAGYLNLAIYLLN